MTSNLINTNSENSKKKKTCAPFDSEDVMKWLSEYRIIIFKKSNNCKKIIIWKEIKVFAFSMRLYKHVNHNGPLNIGLCECTHVSGCVRVCAEQAKFKHLALH